MFRFDIINMLIRKNSYKKYLEIGVKANKNFNKIIVDKKYGVDPAPKTNCKYKMTSDVFFGKYCDDTYDIIFIDGLHIRDQVLRDIENSLRVLSNNGIIIVHDCNPISKEHALETCHINAPIWNGTTWEAFVYLRMTRTDLEMCVVDTDHGCGIIRLGSQELLPRQEISYKMLEENRTECLNLISVDDFLRRL